jgi:hypothetical protein
MSRAEKSLQNAGNTVSYGDASCTLGQLRHCVGCKFDLPPARFVGKRRRTCKACTFGFRVRVVSPWLSYFPPRGRVPLGLLGQSELCHQYQSPRPSIARPLPIMAAFRSARALPLLRLPHHRRSRRHPGDGVGTSPARPSYLACLTVHSIAHSAVSPDGTPQPVARPR